MKELVNQDRALSVGMAKGVVGIIGIAFAITSLMIILLGINTVIGGNLIPGIIQIVGGPALLLAIYMLLRLLVELLLSTHRVNDRLGVVSQTLRDDRNSSSTPS